MPDLRSSVLVLCLLACKYAQITYFQMNLNGYSIRSQSMKIVIRTIRENAEMLWLVLKIVSVFR